jgi:nucleoid-associated protein Lsr2
VTVTDDIDGRPGAETVSFSYAGRSYEIDLGERNKAKLEKVLDPFISAARKVATPSRSAPTGRSAGRKSSSGLDLNAVRSWAVEQGLEVAKRGRIAKGVLEAFTKAH